MELSREFLLSLKGELAEEKIAEEARLETERRDSIDKGSPNIKEHLDLFRRVHLDKSPAIFNFQSQRKWSQENFLPYLTRAYQRCVNSSHTGESVVAEVAKGLIEAFSAHLSNQEEFSHAERPPAGFVPVRVLTANNSVSEDLPQGWRGVLKCQTWEFEFGLNEGVGQAAYHVYLNRDVMNMKLGSRVNILAIRAVIHGDMIIGARWGYWQGSKYFIERKAVNVIFRQHEGNLVCSEKSRLDQLIERFLSLGEPNTPESDSSS